MERQPGLGHLYPRSGTTSIASTRMLGVPWEGPAWANMCRWLLAALWLLDGALQCQPYMFTAKFAKNVLAAAASGQPQWVAAGVSWSARAVGAHPLGLGVAFAATQLSLGIAIFWRRTARFGLYASIAWGIGVWYFGEGLGGLATGVGNLLSGFPGAALVYTLLAIVVLSAQCSPRLAGNVARGGWLVLWFAGGLFLLLSGQYLPGAERDLFTSSAASAPGFLSGAVTTVGRFFSGSDLPGIITGLVEVAVGLLALAPVGLRRAGAVGGLALALFFWIFGQDMGQLWTGSATDPNTAIPLAVLAVVLYCSSASNRSVKDIHRPILADRSSLTPRVRRRLWPA